MDDAADDLELIAPVRIDDDEYASVGLPLSFTGVAYLVLAGLVGINLFDLLHFWLSAVITVPGLLLAFLLALGGLKWDRNQNAARFASLVTGVLLALIIVPFVSFVLLRLALR